MAWTHGSNGNVVWCVETIPNTNHKFDTRNNNDNDTTVINDMEYQWVEIICFNVPSSSQSKSKNNNINGFIWIQIKNLSINLLSWNILYKDKITIRIIIIYYWMTMIQ